MVNCHQLPARHACALVGLSRETYRHESQASALNVQLRQKIVQTAHERRRWGYRMIHDVLRPQFPGINHKQVYRIYTAEGLSIRKRKKIKRMGVRVPVSLIGPLCFVATPKRSGRTTSRSSLAGHS